MAKKAAPKKRIIKGRDYNENKASDGARKAKSGGWRMSGTNRKPTKKEIQAHYDGASNGVYMENRIQRIDRNSRAKKGERFEQGGKVGQKKFSENSNVGKSKYVVNYHDGVKTHKDGSEFYDIEIFKNKKDLESFKTKLLKEGYISKYEKGGEVSASDIKDLSNGYKEAILFTGQDDEEVELDRNYGIEDFDSKANAAIEKMAKQYIIDNKEAIDSAIESGMVDYEQIGRDIWYTQAGHGVGFFDRELDKDVEDKLTKGAKKFGDLSHNVFAQDGKVYLEGMKFEKGGIVSEIQIDKVTKSSIKSKKHPFTFTLDNAYRKGDVVVQRVGGSDMWEVGIDGEPMGRVKAQLKEIAIKKAEELEKDEFAKGGEVKNRTALSEEEKQFVREESQDAGQGYTYRTKVLRGEQIILKEKDGKPIQKFTVDNFEVGSKMSAMLNKASDKENNKKNKMAKGGKVDRTKSAKKTRVNRTKKAITQDKNIKALHAGKRVSENNNVYWEGRENRSDKNRTTKLEKGGLISENWGNDGSTPSNNEDYNNLYALFPDNHEEAKNIWSQLSEKQKEGFINDLDVTDAASEHISESWLEFINSKSQDDYWENATNWDEMEKGGSIKRTKKAIAQDKNIKALHGGKRISESGSVYYENRENRKDDNRTKKLSKGGDLKNYTSADLPKDGSEIKIHMPEMGKFPAEDITVKYNKDNFSFDLYRDGKFVAGRVGENEILGNLNNGLYEFKEGSDKFAKGGEVGKKDINYKLSPKTLNLQLGQYGYDDYARRRVKDWNVDDFNSYSKDMSNSQGDLADSKNTPLLSEIFINGHYPIVNDKIVPVGANNDENYKKYGSASSVFYDIWTEVVNENNLTPKHDDELIKESKPKMTDSEKKEFESNEKLYNSLEFDDIIKKDSPYTKEIRERDRVLKSKINLIAAHEGKDMIYAKGGAVKMSDRELLDLAKQYKHEYGKTVLGYESTWNKGLGRYKDEPVIYFASWDKDYKNLSVESGILHEGEVVNTTGSFDGLFQHDIDALRVAHELSTNKDAYFEEFEKGGKIKLREIEDETVLMPYVIAEPIAETAAEITLRGEFAKWDTLSKQDKETLDEKYKNLVDKISVYLVKRANTVYTHNKSFEKDVKGKKGREVLNTFMEHWCGLVDGKLLKPISDTMARYEKESKSSSFEDGGEVSFENKYEGHSAEEVWNGWNESQRSHFLLDHSELLDNDRTENNLGHSRTVQKDKNYSALTPHTKRVLESHVEKGQYKKGGEIVKFEKLKFNSHKNHNPNTDILEGHIDGDSFITYGIDVNGDKKGTEHMEYYKGSNFVVGSKKPSSSRHYTKEAIPAKWKASWEELKKEYEEKYSKEEFEEGGHIGFDKLAKKVAKEYEGDKVKPEYQAEYGKTYDKEEALEVGQKVAAKVYRGQEDMMKKGGEIKSELTLSEIESKLGKTFSFWDVPYEVSVDGTTYRKEYMGKTYRKI